MSELKHTPGPWAIDWDNPLLIRSRGLKDGNQAVIASCSLESYIHAAKLIGTAEDITQLQIWEESNAKLIAAAPDMYEAIQYAIAALADNGGMVETGELITNVNKARKRLQKAIKSLI